MSKKTVTRCDNSECGGGSDHVSNSFNCGHDICDCCVVYIQKIEDPFGQQLPDGKIVPVCPICLEKAMELK